MRYFVPTAFLGWLALCGNAHAQSLVDAHEKQKLTYGKCDNFSSQLLANRDLNADQEPEAIYLYAFDGCQGKNKIGTALVVFYKERGKWKAAKGDSMLSTTQSTLFSLMETPADAPKDVLVLKNEFDDDAPQVKLKYTKGQVKRVQ